MSILADMFKNVGNKNWDMGRIGGAWAIVSFSFAFIYALIAYKSVPDWAALGMGYGAVLTGTVALIAGKDLARSKAEQPPPQYPPYQEPPTGV